MYTKYLHGINEVETDEINSKIVNASQQGHKIDDVLLRETRLSVTIRHVPKVLNVKLFGALRK